MGKDLEPPHAEHPGEEPREIEPGRGRSTDSALESAAGNELRRLEVEIALLSRLLHTISETNKMMVRGRSVDSLLSEACRIFVESGGFAAAWIGFCSSSDRTVVPVAVAGGTLEAVAALGIRFDDSPAGRGPTGTAIRSGRTVVCQDLENEPMTARWLADIRRHDYRSFASVPIRSDGQVLGALNVYATQPSAISDREVNLLERVTDDLGFALKALENETALRTSEERYRRIVETAAEGILVLDAGRRITYANEEFCRLLGCRTQDLAGSSFDALLFPEDISAVTARWSERQTGVLGRFEQRVRLGDGSTRWVLCSSQPVFDTEGSFDGALVMMTDIHDRRLAEDRVQRTLDRLRRSVNAAVHTLTRTIEMRDPYTAGHQQRVTELSLAIGERLGLAPRTMTSLRIASLIHDLGKISIPAEILAKPGALTEMEHNLIRQHPETGFEILRDMRFPGPVATIVRQHHERLDGSGYPQELCGKQIRICARILGVADVVEAMSSHRPYRAALGIDAALAEISAQRDVKYDAGAVDACVALFREEGFAFSTAS